MADRNILTGTHDPDREQSKMDDALIELEERFEALGTIVHHMENRLGFVMNDYPRDRKSVV